MPIWRALQEIVLPEEPPHQLLHALWDGLDVSGTWRRATESAVSLAICHAMLRSRPPVPGQPQPSGPVRAARGGQPTVLAPTTVRLYGGQRGAGIREEWDEQRIAAAVEAKLSRRVKRRGGGYPEGSFCPVRWDPAPTEVLTERAAYMSWHAVLVAMAMALRGRLDTIAILEPGALAAPWADDQEAGKVSSLYDRQLPLPYRIESRAEATQRRLAGARRVRPRHGPVRTIRPVERPQRNSA
jgi:hypothetical protein